MLPFCFEENEPVAHAMEMPENQPRSLIQGREHKGKWTRFHLLPALWPLRFSCCHVKSQTSVGSLLLTQLQQSVRVLEARIRHSLKELTAWVLKIKYIFEYLSYFSVLNYCCISFPLFICGVAPASAVSEVFQLHEAMIFKFYSCLLVNLTFCACTCPTLVVHLFFSDTKHSGGFWRIRWTKQEINQKLCKVSLK